MEGAEEEGVYSVWVLPSKDVSQRLKEVMKGLNKYFRGPEFEPHITVVGAIRLTKADAIQKFKYACEGLKSYTAQVGSIARGTFFYQCVFLLLKTTPEEMSTSEHCIAHFGYKSSSPSSPPSVEGTTALNHSNPSDS